MVTLVDHVRTMFSKQVKTSKIEVNRTIECDLLNHFDKELLRLDLTPSLAAMERYGVSIFAYELHNVKPYSLSEDASINLNYSYLTVSGSMLGLCLQCVKKGKLSPSQDCFSNLKTLIEDSDTQSCGKKRKVETNYFLEKMSRLRRFQIRPTGSHDEEIRKTVGDCNCMAPTRREHERWQGAAE